MILLFTRLRVNIIPLKSTNPKQKMLGTCQEWLPDTTTHQTTFRDEFAFKIKRAAHGQKQLLAIFASQKTHSRNTLNASYRNLSHSGKP